MIFPSYSNVTQNIVGCFIWKCSADEQMFRVTHRHFYR